ncbi:MAG: type II toxin-antitoxin system RelE/ParE family toxin [Bacteroidota bacterium]
MARYLLTIGAVKDLEEIWIYTFEHWSVEQADRYYTLIIDEIEFLSSNPASGQLMDHIKEGYRASKVKSHLVFYKITGDKTIEVVRILHERMDVENRMK